MRIGLAFSCFFRLLFGKKLPAAAAALVEGGVPPALAPVAPSAPAPTAQVSAAPAPAVATVTQPAKLSKAERDAHLRDGALGLLAILQEEGRLIDFLREDIAGFSDADIGAAARAVHRGCARVVDGYLTLEPIIPGEEDAQITLPLGFSPQEIRTSSASAGKPADAGATRGILRHHGWRATNVKFPQWADGIDRTVIAPAQVDLN